MNGVYTIQYEIGNKNLIENDTTTNIKSKFHINYLSMIPHEIILLIIDKLPDDYSTINFCIAINKCDKHTLGKLAYLHGIYCWQCENVKLKYYNCYDCNKKLCSDCVRVCEYCEDNVVKGEKYSNVDLNKDTYYCVGGYGNFKKSCRCMDQRPWMFGNPKVRDKTKYYLNFDCQECEKNICSCCVSNPDPWTYYCSECILDY
jgi:hypothetical protein